MSEEISYKKPKAAHARRCQSQKFGRDTDERRSGLVSQQIAIAEDREKATKAAGRHLRPELKELFWRERNGESTPKKIDAEKEGDDS